MTKMKACWRLAASALGLALLGNTAAFAQTTPPATPPKTASPAATPTPAPANNDQAPVPGTLSAVPQAPNGQAGDAQNGNFTIKTNVNEVNLIFTVTDKHGRFIPNLQQRDFALLDNQKAPSQVFNFTQQTNLPLRVGIMIDASTSIRQRFEFEQSAAIQFLQQVILPHQDLAFVMGFDMTRTTQNYTNDQGMLQAASASSARAAVPPSSTPYTRPAATR